VRVLCYAQNLSGVGHFVRMHTIATALATRHDVHLVEGGRAFPRPAFTSEPGRVPLPVLRRGGVGELAAADGGPATGLVEERTDQLAAVVVDLRPDVLLVDHYPFSKWELSDEIDRAADAARRANPGARVVCSLRDIAPRTPHERAHPDQYDEEVLRRLASFDAVIVHADPRMTTLRDHFRAADRITIPVRYSGLVVEPVVAGRGIPESAYAVASAGGLDATVFLVAAIEAFEALVTSAAIPPMPLHVFAPANAPQRELATIAAAAGAGVVVHEFSDAFGAWLDRAELSISRGGYNTVTALLRSRVPAVVVPDPSVSDQRPRAAMLQASNLAVFVDDGGVPDVAALQDGMVTALARGRPAVELDLDGAAVTGDLLERLAAGESPWAPERAA
jgi:predicted glycosyltransferase